MQCEQNQIVLTPALRELFEDDWRKYRVIYFGAPCGFGKTTAARALMDTDLSAEEIARCEDLKTGVLLSYCVEAGALLAGCEGEDRQRLIRFSEKLGLAFQIRDDILDRIGDESAVGKRLRKDRQAGRRTAVDAWGLDGARDKSISLVASAHEELAGFGPRAQLLQQIADFAVTRMH